VYADPVDIGVAGGFSGQLEDMSHTTNKSGYSFRVLMRGLRYQGQLGRTVVETTGENRHTIWLGLRNFYVRIERTDIAGQPGRAACGPLDLVLGNQRELWLGFDVQTQADPTNENEVRLVLLETRFRLPPDNWSIGAPAWVKTSGFGMSRENVVSGIRRGLSENRERIAGRVIKSAPAIYAQAAALTDKLPPLVEQRAQPQPSGAVGGESLTTLGDPSSREWKQTP
jgi:hypothetical protein